MSEASFEALRGRFPLLDERLYFASQCFGPMPAEALDDLDDYRRSLLLRKRALPLWIERMNELTGLIETLLHAPAGSVALRDSATAAHAAIASALVPRRDRNRILVSSQDFHSIRYLWGAQARRGFEVIEIQPRGGTEVSAEQVLEAIDERTAVVSAALVSPRNGSLLDAAAVIHAAHDHGALVVLDAYQAVGVVPIDVTRLGADVIVGGTHKWLGGGGTGLAFLYVRPSLANELEPAYPGWIGHTSLLSFGDRYAPAPGARRFQQGTPALEPIYTARAGLLATLAIGVDRIRARSLELTARLIARCEASDLRVLTPTRAEARGGMICVALPDAEAVDAALEHQGIDIDYRPNTGLRIGPHFCHREDECDRVIDAIVEARRS